MIASVRTIGRALASVLDAADLRVIATAIIVVVVLSLLLIMLAAAGGVAWTVFEEVREF